VTLWEQNQVGCQVFRAPLHWTEKAYPKLIHYNKVDKAAIS